MKISERINKLISGKKSSYAIVVVGVIGLICIMIPTFIPEKKEDVVVIESQASDYLLESEQRLKQFLESIEGVGKTKVMITLEGDEYYIYAKEGKSAVSENKTEREEEYVMSGGNKTPIIETVQNPQIKGVVVACEGASSPAVQEMVYNTVSRVFQISTSCIYVTKLI